MFPAARQIKRSENPMEREPVVLNTAKSENEYRKQFILSGFELIHFLLSLALFFTFWLFFRYGFFQTQAYGYRYNYYITAAYAALLLFFTRTYNAYLFGYSRIRTLVFGQFISQFFSLTIIYFVVSFAWRKWHSPWIFLGMLGIQLISDVVWSYFGNKIFFHLNPQRKTLLIYRNAVDRRRLETVKGKPTDRLFRIENEICCAGMTFQELRPRLEGYEALFVAGVDSRCRNGIAKYCKENSITGFFLPHVGDVIMQEAVHIQSFDAPVLCVKRTSLDPEYRIIKRVFDVAASIVGLIIASPVMLLTAIAIRLYDGGPALYRQVRLTKDGKEFRILKFRSMRMDAEKDGVARLSTGENDPRITPVGRLIRKCRVDELPQLFNILKGDMSFVGPRPERPEIAEKYCEKMPDFRLRLQVKAGLTGYAQVYGKYNTDPYEKLEFDLLYINHMSVLTDLQLMFATFGILFKEESTEGIDVGKITAEEE